MYSWKEGMKITQPFALKSLEILKAAWYIAESLRFCKVSRRSNQILSFRFQVMTLNPVCENVETAQGVPLTVTGVAQVKIMKNADLLQTASEQFLGKKEHEIKSTVLQTLEGHLRAILGEFIGKPYKFFG